MNISDDGMNNLVFAMFRYAAQDIRVGNNECKESAQDFVKSKWFSDICDGIGLDSESVKERILHDPVKYRKTHE